MVYRTNRVQKISNITVYDQFDLSIKIGEMWMVTVTCDSWLQSYEGASEASHGGPWGAAPPGKLDLLLWVNKV
jgi:hypothetical protein